MALSETTEVTQMKSQMLEKNSTRQSQRVQTDFTNHKTLVIPFIFLCIKQPPGWDRTSSVTLLQNAEIEDLYYLRPKHLT